MTQRRIPRVDPNDNSPRAKFQRVLNLFDLLPGYAFPPDDKVPLREVMPRSWPTVADLRALLADGEPSSTVKEG